MQKKGATAPEPITSLTNRALVSFIAEENFAGLQHVLESRKVVVDDRDEVSSELEVVPCLSSILAYFYYFSQNGTTALMVACQRGQLSFVRALVDHGADVNAEDLVSCHKLQYIQLLFHQMLRSIFYFHC